MSKDKRAVFSRTILRRPLQRWQQNRRNKRELISGPVSRTAPNSYLCLTHMTSLRQGVTSISTLMIATVTQRSTVCTVCPCSVGKYRSFFLRSRIKGSEPLAWRPSLTEVTVRMCLLQQNGTGPTFVQ